MKREVPTLKCFLGLFAKRCDPTEFDPKIVPLQNAALDRLRKARLSGDQGEINDAFDVALELDALGLMP